MGDLTAVISNSISEIDPGQWDSCVGEDNPHVRHAYLFALEESGCVTPEKGFTPHHITIHDKNDIIIAAAPAYIKDHSEGEIGTELAWSMAHERSIGPYYPKLQVEVPFTPVSGKRLLVRPGQDELKLKEVLLEALKAIVEDKQLSSLHISYIQEDDQNFLNRPEFRLGRGLQFQWINKSYPSFQDFTRSLKKGKRQTIQKERKCLSQNGLTAEWFDGKQITPELMSIFCELNKNTQVKYNGSDSYNVSFFQLLNDLLAPFLRLVMIKKEHEYVAGCLCFHNGETLAAQYWGCLEDIKFLHFETSYYQVIEFAIRNRYEFIDAGPPGGKHKTARGYTPKIINHAHWFRSKDFANLITRGLEKRARQLKIEYDAILSHSPYKGDSMTTKSHNNKIKETPQ